jgi:enamine deaminase RidA (YjgF/YER057c/UK114 family)
VIAVPGQVGAFPGAVGEGWLVVTSGVVSPGQLAAEPVDEDAATQLARALDALGDVLVRAGSGLDRVLRVEAFLSDAADLPAWNCAFDRAWPTRRPARSTLVVAFALPGVLAELQAIAVRER